MPPIYIGPNQVVKRYLGNTEITKVYLGVLEAYTSSPAVLAVVTPIAPAAYYGTTRLSTYSTTGPVFDVVRPSDSASLTINFSNNKPDITALNTFLGSEIGQVSKLYDQSGNGYHATASSNRPKVKSSIGTNGIPSIIFDGSNGAPVITAQMTIPSELTLNIQNLAMIFAGRQSISQNTSCWVSLSNSVPATIAKWQELQGVSYVATSTQTTPTYPPTNPAVFATSTNGTNTKHFEAERVFSRTSTTGTGMSVGGIIGNDVGGVSRGMFELNGLALFSSAISDVDIQTIRASLEATLSIQTTFTDTISITGDSILQGTGTTLCANLTRQLFSLLKRPTRIINAGVFGATMASIASGTAYHTVFSGWTQTNRVWVLESGTNDIANGTTGSALSVIAAARIADAKSAGQNKVGVCTILPRQTWVTDTAKWVEAQAYNDLVRANYLSWGADFIVDLAADPTMGNISNCSNTSLYTDGLHPSSLGNGYLASVYAAAINSQI